ncbi:transmembrane protein, putative [Medicago truncatula]|uniref:Transmembrane protein, putative n=1 Tax=Medicago truncatula TaxID=3880 RepID=A0A072TZV2_MEDTR|nr:transmembrane protein, putative [Medicago truncatula]
MTNMCHRSSSMKRRSGYPFRVLVCRCSVLTVVSLIIPKIFYPSWLLLASLVDSGRLMSFVHPLIWTAPEVSRPLRFCGFGS